MLVDDDNTAAGARSEASHRRFTLINRSPGSAQNAKARAKKSAQEVAKGGAHRISRSISAAHSLPQARKRPIEGRSNSLLGCLHTDFKSKKASLRKPFNNWCGRRDLNPHSQRPLPPQDSVSTNSTTPANCVLHSPSIAGASFRGRSP